MYEYKFFRLDFYSWQKYSIKIKDTLWGGVRWIGTVVKELDKAMSSLVEAVVTQNDETLSDEGLCAIPKGGIGRFSAKPSPAVTSKNLHCFHKFCSFLSVF